MAGSAKVLPATWTLSSGKGREDPCYLQRPSLPGQLLALKSDRDEEKSGSSWSRVRILKGKETRPWERTTDAGAKSKYQNHTAFHTQAGMAAWALTADSTSSLAGLSDGPEQDSLHLLDSCQTAAMGPKLSQATQQGALAREGCGSGEMHGC